MRSGNPVLRESTFKNLPFTGTDPMTIQGTVNKVFLALLIVLAGASITWRQAVGVNLTPILIGAMVGGLVLAIATTLKKEWSPVTAPLYAALEGLMLGGISIFAERAYPGIVLQAMGLTFGTLFSLLAVYRAGWIQVSEKFKLGIAAATGGILLFYVTTFLLGLFGIHLPFITGSSPLSIGISLFVVVIAALNLVIDFDFIEKAAAARTPKYMEWYGAFAIMVTLIWLYIEILNLLMKLQNRIRS